MPVNGSDFIDEPFNTTLKPFTDLFERFLGEGFGLAFFIIPLSIIAVALYMKTRDPVMVSMYMLASGALFASGGAFMGMGGMVIVYILFAALGITGLFMSLFFRR